MALSIAFLCCYNDLAQQTPVGDIQTIVKHVLRLPLLSAPVTGNHPTAQQRHCPVQPDRCQWVYRSRSLLKGLPCGARTRDSAPLTVILNGKRIVGTVGRATAPIRLGVVPETA